MSIIRNNINSSDDSQHPFDDNESNRVVNNVSSERSISNVALSHLLYDADRPITLDQIPVSNSEGIFENVDISSLALGDASVHLGDLHFIAEKADLPTPSGGVIQLGEGQVYFFTSNVDLTGDRLVGAANSCIIGASSENAFITSTGLTAGTPLLYSEYTCPVRHITFHDVDTGIHLNGTALGGVAIDWTGVNFSNVPNVGLVDQVDNFIWDKGSLLSSNNLEFNGTMGTVALNNSLFTTGSATESILVLKSGLNITRRFRLTYSSIVAWGTSVGIEIEAGATIPDEGFILDSLNFSGGANYVSGLTYNDLEPRWIECKGIVNTAHIGGMYIHNSTTPTALFQGVPTKIEGTSVANTINQKFDHANNKLTYVGATSRDFEITTLMTFYYDSGSGLNTGLYTGINGTPISESEMYTRSQASGEFIFISNSYITELNPNDYVEMFIENADSNNNPRVAFMQTTIKALN